MLAEMEEENQDVVCIDDVAGEELPWHAVRKAREQDLKYLRDLGVYEKIDEREASARYQVTPVDTKWIDTDKAFEGKPMQIRSRLVPRKFKSDDRPDLYAGTPLQGSVEVHDLDCSKPQGNILNHVYRRVTCILSRKGSETCAGAITWGEQSGRRCWKSWAVEEEHVWHTRRCEPLGV